MKFEPPHIFNDIKLHIAKDGRVFKIEDMATEHLKNLRDKLIEKENNPITQIEGQIIEDKLRTIDRVLRERSVDDDE